MAFGARQINPIDTRPGTAVGVSIPFNNPSVFSSTYTTKDAIKNNLINYLLTEPGERYLNANFGAGLKRFIFEHITNNNISLIKETIQEKVKTHFPNIIISNINITQDQDSNEISISISYNIRNTGINDRIQINFT